MVKVAIIGAQHPMAGEIIRILINHPETELVTLFSSELPGRSVSAIHHGLIGEPTLYFSDKLKLSEIDLAISLDTSSIAKNIIKEAESFEDLKVISLFPNKIDNAELGIPEINRKALVRGAKKAFIPHPLIVTSLIPLVPLARFMLLNSDIDIHASLPQDLIDTLNPNDAEETIAQYLSLYQPSFQGKVRINFSPVEKNNRGITTKIQIKTLLPVEEVENIYEQTYDDHNFTFMTGKNIETNEVIGTQKNIIQVSKSSPDSLEITNVADARLRGGAGDAVHILNLFFGLHEKTGLALKPSVY